MITRQAKNSFWAQRPEASCYYNESSSAGRLAELLRLHPNKYSDRLLNGASVTDIARVFLRWLLERGTRHKGCCLETRFGLFWWKSVFNGVTKILRKKVLLFYVFLCRRIVVDKNMFRVNGPKKSEPKTKENGYLGVVVWAKWSLQKQRLPCISDISN